jgi:5-methylcytosine-specific restriction endonuclease McrA
MPSRLCQQAGCPDPVVYRGRCQRHARQRNRDTHRNRKAYNSKRWAMTRKRQLSLEPLCAVCGHIATDVDHITPIEQGGAVWSFDNLQSLCAVHHGQKTRREQATR